MPRPQLVVSVLALLAGAALPAIADPVLISTPTPVGGGLVQHAVSIDFADGRGRSGFIEISFSGNFDSSSLDTDSWPDIQSTTQTSTLVELRGGTGGGSSVDVVPIGTLTLPAGEFITYSGVASRNGLNFVLVPEPGAGAAGAVALAVAALLRAGRRPRPVA